MLSVTVPPGCPRFLCGLLSQGAEREALEVTYNRPAFLFFLISLPISSQERRPVFSWGLGQNPVTRVVFHPVPIGGALTPHLLWQLQVLQL